MKIKQEFVTNSSSTSYIFSIKDYDPEKDEIVIREKISNLHPIILTTVEDVGRHMLDYYGYGNDLEQLLEGDDFLQERYGAMKAAIERGEEVMVVRVSNEDYEGIQLALFETGLDKDSFADNTKERASVIYGEPY